MKAPTRRSRPAAKAGPDTLIFVDVDGVLNVGIKDDDPKSQALSLSLENLTHCYETQHRATDPASLAIMDKLLSASRLNLESLGEEYATYEELLSCNDALDLDVMLVFVQRLAMIIRAAGPRRLVVLCSSWRRPQHGEKIQKLEKLISNMLGEPFAFDERTPLKEDQGATGRLRGIHSFIQAHVAARGTSQQQVGPLRLLVLEDFHITPFDGWRCDGKIVSSVQDAESYLKSAVPEQVPSRVRIVYPYAEWRTDSGRLVQAGTGLTMKHFRNGMDFLMTAPTPLVLPQDCSAREKVALASWSSHWTGMDTDAWDAEQCTPSKASEDEFSSQGSIMEATSIASTADALAFQNSFDIASLHYPTRGAADYGHRPACQGWGSQGVSGYHGRGLYPVASSPGKFCTQCGTTRTPGHSFCPMCGEKFM